MSKLFYHVVMILPAPKKGWLIDSFQKDEPAAQIWWLQFIHNLKYGDYVRFSTHFPKPITYSLNIFGPHDSITFSTYVSTRPWSYETTSNADSSFSILTMDRVAIMFLELGVVKHFLKNSNCKWLCDYFIV